MIGDVLKLGGYMQTLEVAARPRALTRRWTIHSGNVPAGDVGQQIGSAFWHSPWRRYVVEMNAGVVLDVECLTALAEFVQRRTTEHRATRQRADRHES